MKSMSNKRDNLSKNKSVQSLKTAHIFKVSMKIPFLVWLQIFFTAVTVFSQDSTSTQKIRQDNLDLILRMKDTRTISNSKLINLLSDPDSLVREQAIFAFGSIQDTSVLNLLVEKLPDPNAVFAICQTATLLSPKGKESLQNELIWTRMKAPDDQLIEGIGKFGTAAALNDLLLRFRDSHPSGLIMSIARFAVRGITSRDAIQYLYDNIQSNRGQRWQSVYALQRIGDHPDSRAHLGDVRSLFNHDDPLVRMNLAALFSKVRDERVCLEPLQKMAEFDSDWRVRVNALRALGNYDLQKHDDIAGIFKKAFFSDNMNIALTAISSFGTSKITKQNSTSILLNAIAALESFTANSDGGYQWQLQAAAAVAIAQFEREDALQSIHPGHSAHLLLDGELLNAVALTGSKNALDIILPYLNDEKPFLRRAALDAMMELSRQNRRDSLILEKTCEAALHGLKDGDVAIVTSAAAILGDSLFLRERSVEPLMNVLSSLRVPDDVEAIQQVIATLEALNNRRALIVLEPMLDSPDHSIAAAAASALKSLTGQDYSTAVSAYHEPLFTDYDFAYLHLLPDTVVVSMQTTRGEVMMELYKNYAPFTVMSFLKLASQRGFYRGLSFHRVVPNFVVQGGDPRGDGWGGPGYSIRSEFSPLRYETGSVGLASSGKDTEGSQFFITHSPQPHLDGRYTIFGKVISGMDVVASIQLGDNIFDITRK
jgi:cyclophilin family peptidyl-prolyl cis-trans isomerase/HEAT repeat protein